MRSMQWFLLSVVAVGRAQLVLYNSSSAINSAETLSAPCEAALMANITCPSSLFNSAASGELVSSDNTTVPLICSPGCTGSLEAYHYNVSSACGNDSYPWNGTPATWPGDVLWAFANQTCLTDNSTGQYCVDEFLTWSGTLDTNGTLLSEFPKQDLCTSCMIKLLAQAQSTSFSNYASALVSDWQGVQEVCNVTYPTNVQPGTTNITIADLPNFANTSTSVAVPCISNRTYLARPGHSCNSIAISQSVASGTLIITNDLYADCSDLTPGRSLCLPQVCSTYQVQTNDTCWSIAAAQNVGVYQLQSWNPALNSGCTNIVPGSIICISPPGAAWNGTLITGATPTQISSYATTTVIPPGQTPYGTTARCGAYYKANSGDTCQQISLNRTITATLFEEINPSLNTNCTNVTPGFYYCVLPTSDWNSTISNNTTNSSVVVAPAPTPSGTTSRCYAWHTIQANDSCSSMETEYAITFHQLQMWNPSLNSTCGNLVLGDAYCVSGINSTGLATSGSRGLVSSGTPAASPTKRSQLSRIKRVTNSVVSGLF